MTNLLIQELDKASLRRRGKRGPSRRRDGDAGGDDVRQG